MPLGTSIHPSNPSKCFEELSTYQLPDFQVEGTSQNQGWLEAREAGPMQGNNRVAGPVSSDRIRDKEIHEDDLKSRAGPRKCRKSTNLREPKKKPLVWKCYATTTRSKTM